MKELTLSEKTYPGTVKSTTFFDGMVANADDLATAMMYPVELMQTFMQAYFGCGIVCGFNVRLKDPKNPSNYCLVVEPGVALDCAAFPLRLCDPAEINLTPQSCDPCDPLAYKNLPQRVCIAIRREVVNEAPRSDGNVCDAGGKPVCQYSRAREAIVIKAFAEECLPENICKHEAQVSRAENFCDCVQTCADCHCCQCCGDSWVLLACVEVTADGLQNLDNSVRRHIKPFSCICDAQRIKAPMVSAIAQGVQQAAVSSDRYKGSYFHITGTPFITNMPPRIDIPPRTEFPPRTEIPPRTDQPPRIDFPETDVPITGIREFVISNAPEADIKKERELLINVMDKVIETGISREEFGEKIVEKAIDIGVTVEDFNTRIDKRTEDAEIRPATPKIRIIDNLIDAGINEEEFEERIVKHEAGSLASIKKVEIEFLDKAIDSSFSPEEFEKFVIEKNPNLNLRAIHFEDRIIERAIETGISLDDFATREIELAEKSMLSVEKMADLEAEAKRLEELRNSPESRELHADLIKSASTSTDDPASATKKKPIAKRAPAKKKVITAKKKVPAKKAAVKKKVRRRT